MIEKTTASTADDNRPRWTGCRLKTSVVAWRRYRAEALATLRRHELRRAGGAEDARAGNVEGPRGFDSAEGSRPSASDSTESTSSPRHAEAAESTRGAATSREDGGWRRFGEPGQGRSSDRSAGRTEGASGVAREDGGWRRFGEPASTGRSLDAGGNPGPRIAGGEGHPIQRLPHWTDRHGLRRRQGLDRGS